MFVCLYARVSTTRQADNDLSIPDQLKQMRDWCRANGHAIVQEYVEPGASATDDKRPVFQQMASACMEKPAPFAAIIIHSLSRFFRDMLDFGNYERKLLKNGVRVISITQPTSDDPAGEMTRRFFSLFDEYQSKENSKHTSRAMRENARQGFFNGSHPPFGYAAVSTEINGSRGRKKKRLEISEAEAAIVRRIYDLYLNGHEGKSLGIKAIVQHLTERGQLRCGIPWSIQGVHEVLSSLTCTGEYYFNRTNVRSRTPRPESDWIRMDIPPIIGRETWEAVRALRESRAPGRTPPRLVGNATLLTGLLRCGECGARMTLVTGKGGRYRYYKCTSRQGKGNHACQSRNLPMEKLDEFILAHLAERVLVPERLQVLIDELRKRTAHASNGEQRAIKELEKQLKTAEERLARLYEAIETGTIELDDTLKSRVQKLKASKESTLVELAGVRRQHHIPAARILSGNIEAFSKALRKRLESGTEFAKRYLQVLVDEIVINAGEATIKGSYDKLAFMVQKQKEGNLEQVPSFMPDWRPHGDSNPGTYRERVVS